MQDTLGHNKRQCDRREADMSRTLLKIQRFSGFTRSTIVLCGVMFLAGCEEGQMPGFLQPKPAEGAAEPALQTGKTRLVERDVEAPEVFEAREAGLWDGRPSLGGVWSAHPNVKDPERVIIRNETNGKFVIGALFRKERETPGPRLQISSDAAAALGMVAGSPTKLHVVALRREEEPEVAEAPAPVDAPSEGALDAPSAIDTTALADVEDIAAAALEPVAATPAPAPTPTPAASTPRTGSTLERPFIQIGIFSVEQNAKNTAEAMRQRGMVPLVKKQTSKGKTFWRVVVGPAQNKSEFNELLKKIKSAGFSDAYAVTN